MIRTVTVSLLASLAIFTLLMALPAQTRAEITEDAVAASPAAESQPESASAYGHYYRVDYYCHGCWYKYGNYYCYSSACDAAYYLRCKGYSTRTVTCYY